MFQDTSEVRRGPRGTAVGLYGGGGLAAIAGAVLWYFLGSEEVRITSMPGVSASIQISGDL